jgi:hypothetical protein
VMTVRRLLKSCPTPLGASGVWPHSAGWVPGDCHDLGLMPKIGEWSLREACRQLTVWHAVCPQVRPLTVSVNFALLHFLDADLAALIQQTLRHGPRSVESEDRNY